MMYSPIFFEDGWMDGWIEDILLKMKVPKECFLNNAIEEPFLVPSKNLSVEEPIFPF